MRGCLDGCGVSMAAQKLNSPPSSFTVFIVLLAVRTLSALYNNINDCDEAYNYWEPVSITQP